MDVRENHIRLLRQAGLKDYHAHVVSHLLALGEAKAPELSQMSGVPRARIYGVLRELANQGLIEVRPGWPAIYKAKPPDEILRRLILNRRAEMQREIEVLQRLRGEFKRILSPLYNVAFRRSRRPLVKILSVGRASEEETRLMYREAKKEINIVSRAMEWLPKVKRELIKASARGIKVKILLLKPDLLKKKDLRIQRNVLQTIKKDVPRAEVRYSQFSLPLRGSIVDPSYEYKSGKAIFLVEERGVPLVLREVAVTDNPSLVAGMKRYFDLIWDHESTE